MTGFDIKSLSNQLEDIAGMLAPSHRLTPGDRELLRVHISELRKFFSVCEAHKSEIETIINWAKRPVRR